MARVNLAGVFLSPIIAIAAAITTIVTMTISILAGVVSGIIAGYKEEVDAGKEHNRIVAEKRRMKRIFKYELLADEGGEQLNHVNINKALESKVVNEKAKPESGSMTSKVSDKEGGVNALLGEPGNDDADVLADGEFDDEGVKFEIPTVVHNKISRRSP